MQRQNFGGYRANIVTYTIALLSNATNLRLDLGMIWRQQALTETLKGVIADLAHGVHGIITDPPEGRNITEWCKSEGCWNIVRENTSVAAVSRLGSEMLSADAVHRENRRSLSELPDEFVENMKRVVSISSEGWRLLAEWGAQTDALDVSEQQLARRITRALEGGRMTNKADAERAVGMLDRAVELGYHAEA